MFYCALFAAKTCDYGLDSCMKQVAPCYYPDICLFFVVAAVCLFQFFKGWGGGGAVLLNIKH